MFLKLFAQPDPDGILVAAARDGDVRAFDALVYRYQGHVTQFVRARLDAVIDAEDVAQEIFVAAWRDLPRFRGQSRFKTWLFGIAVHQCAEASRRHRRLKLILGGLEETDGRWETPNGAAQPDSVDWARALAERDEIREQLAGLAGPERELLELYYYAELNLREISQLLDVNLSTLKYRFYQAHRRLRQGLARREGSEAKVHCRREP